MNSAQLNEGLSDIVFHLTSIQRAANILRTNQFNLSSVFHSEHEKSLQQNKLFYISFSRSMMGHFFKSQSGVFNTALVINGKELSYNYKGKPINYFHPLIKKPNDNTGKIDETEDRIYNNKPIIPNARRYIMEINVLLPSKFHRSQHLSPTEVWSFEFLRDTGIPFFAYKEKKDFLLRNKKKSISLDSFIHYNKSIDPQTNEKRKNQLQKWTNLINYIEGDIDSLPENSLDILMKVFSHEDIKNKIDDLSEDLYFDFSVEKNNHENNHEFHMMIKTYNLKNIRDFIKLLIKKWNKFIRDPDGNLSKYLDPDIQRIIRK